MDDLAVRRVLIFREVQHFFPLTLTSGDTLFGGSRRPNSLAAAIRSVTTGAAGPAR